ncbi:hypothetical protein D3C80_1541520 [compost metagenome]
MRVALQHLLKLKRLCQPGDLRCGFIRRQTGKRSHVLQLFQRGIIAEIEQRVLGKKSC